MKLNEIIKLFEHFGFASGNVKDCLSRGDSAFNAFEGLKTKLQFKWDTMNQELSSEKLIELKPIYDRIMKITLKSAKRQSDVDQEYNVKRTDFIKSAKEMLEDRKERRLGKFYDAFSRRMNKD